MSIPKLIHSFWSGPPMPTWVKQSIASWEQHYPDHEIKIWTEATAPRLRMQELYDNPRKYSPKSGEYQWKTNLLRIELLHDQAGYWLDADVMALRNAEELIAGYSAFVARESPGYLNNGLMGAVAGHPFIAELLDRAPQRILDNPNLRSNRTCGPHLLTDAIWNHPDVKIIPQHQGLPARWDQLDRKPSDFPDAYFFSWWNNKRQKRHQGA